MKYLILVMLCLIVLNGCDDDSGGTGENRFLISYYDSDDSHHAGENCMDCHHAGSDVNGWFTVAGTIYEPNQSIPNPNTTIKLYTDPAGTGTLVKTIEVDALGNFYTTETIDWGEGLYVEVLGKNEYQYMLQPNTSGECNHCHTGDQRIYVN